MSFLFTVLRQLGRNLRQTWGVQIMTLLTVALSVLIFSFSYLVYTNIVHFGDRLSENIRLIVYLDEEPGPELRKQLERKILQFDDVEEINFVSREQAYNRFKAQLGENAAVLDGMPKNFLSPSVEVVPLNTLTHLNRLKDFSDYLSKMGGIQKVQFGQNWVEKFNYTSQLITIIVIASGALLILTTIFIVAHTIRLTILGRHNELELLKLVGATNNYIRAPFLLEGLLQGLLGSSIGLGTLYALFLWVKIHFTTSGFMAIFDFTFLNPWGTVIIILSSILLCTIGSWVTMQRFVKVC
ncbi:FtsX-like permease family protein [Desulforhopalus vacuolatus]|uniref:cell division protein FtsX n=1 Tax=Desulforhopalus vacuolatus TaxID=40414 RepID=UPI0019665199|nr:permease-like cell division protein FtsX [Desulforhopalus vacuolatus]MBM9519583.1 FtsX-like permease family protein [Desulforhopalus vacuolatus]